jgi:hypothetical protein
MVIFVPTPWTRIVSMERFEKVQAIIESRKTKAAGRKRADCLMLSELVFCECGSPMVTISSKTHEHTLVCKRKKVLGDCTGPRLPLIVAERAVLLAAGSILADGTKEAEFIELIKQEAENRAIQRGATRDNLKKEIADLTAQIDAKLAASIPDDVDLKEAWNRMMTSYAQRKRAAEASLQALMAPVAATSLNNKALPLLREQLDSLIAKAPLIGFDESSIRTRALMRSLIKEVRLKRTEAERGELTIVFDFGGELGLEDHARAVFSRTAPVDLVASRARARLQVEAIDPEVHSLTEEQADMLDNSMLGKRGFKKGQTRDLRKRIYTALLLRVTTSCALGQASRKAGLNPSTVSNFMREFQGPGDVAEIERLLQRARPDLEVRSGLLVRGTPKSHRNVRSRFVEAEHPLLDHPLAGSLDRLINDEEWQAIDAALPENGYFKARPEHFRRNLDLLLHLLRTGCSLEIAPAELGSRFSSPGKFLDGSELKHATKALLVHAGLLEPGERILFAPVPTYTNGRA